MFATPSRTWGRATTSGHTTPERTRFTPRTSLHSPYSACPTRVSPRKSSTRDSSGSALCLQDEPARGAVQTPPCSPQRRPLPRYQKRLVSQTRMDPTASAIRSTYAEEFNNTIPALIKRLDGLSLEDCVWEDLIMEDASQQGIGGLAFLSSCLGGLHHISTYTVAPSTPSAPLIPFPPTTPTYAISPQLSSAESSPIVQTPVHPSFMCAVNTSTSIHASSSLPASLGGIHDTPNTVSTYSPSPEDEFDASFETELEKQLLALIEEEISTSTVKKGPCKKPHEKRAQNTAKRTQKPKAISATQIIAHKAAITAQASTETIALSSTCQAGPSTPRRLFQPSPVCAPDVLSAPSGPVNRRRRGRATEDMIWKGVGTKLQSAQHTSRRRRSASEPYSQEQRLQRGQKADKGVAEMPKCVTKSRDVMIGASSGVAKGHKARAKRRSSLPSSESSSATLRTFIAPKPLQRSRSQSAVSRNGRADVEDGYQSADEAQYLISDA